jgi:PTH1 family peptidyl-tRNA hydrolase
MGQPIELIAGLGNPDPEYLATRHNAGFWLVDALASSQGARFTSDRKLEAERAEVELAGARVRLLKPMTYMNHSGRALAKAVNYYKIPLEHVLVAYDEIDLPPGRVKLKLGGGHAGHNGMRSIIEHVGPAFWRIRLGVGHPGQRDRVVGHVLKRASEAEQALIMDGVLRAIESLPILIEHGPERAQNRLHAPPQDAEADARNADDDEQRRGDKDGGPSGGPDRANDRTDDGGRNG